MTITVWAINASGGSPAEDAASFRTAMSSLITPSGSSRPLGATSGRRVGGGLEVTVASWPTITIQPGAAVLDTESPVATGPYLTSSNAVDTSLTGTAANGSNPRIDIVSLRIDDTDVDASGNRRGIFVYTAGSAGASPSAPTTPPRCLRLCTINVPKVGTGSPSVAMDTAFTVASGGILPTLSTGRPASPYAGQSVFETDTNLLRLHDGTSWTPTWNHIGDLGSLFGTNSTDNDASETTQYRVGFLKDRFGIGHLRGVLACSTAKPAGYAMFNLPAGYRNAKQTTYAPAVFGNSNNPTLLPIVQNPNGDWAIQQAAGTSFLVCFDGISYVADA